MALVLSSEDVPAAELSDLAKRRTIKGESLMLTRYEVKKGAEFPGHSHPEEQMGYVIEGHVAFLCRGARDSTRLYCGHVF